MSDEAPQYLPWWEMTLYVIERKGAIVDCAFDFWVALSRANEDDLIIDTKTGARHYGWGGVVV